MLKMWYIIVIKVYGLVFFLFNELCQSEQYSSLNKLHSKIIVNCTVLNSILKG